MSQEDDWGFGGSVGEVTGLGASLDPSQFCGRNHLVHTFAGLAGCLLDFDFYMTVLGVGRGPIGLIAPLIFKMLDSQPERSKLSP